MKHSGDILTRRGFLAVGGAGLGAVALAPRILAAAPTASEQANLDVVNAFCAAWGVPLDWNRLGSFLATDCKFRPTQTTPAIEGRDAIIGMLRDFSGNANSCEFEVLDSWARGPIVVNERVDRFALPDQSMEFPVAGVFHLIDGKIAEWSDYTF